MPSAGDCPIGSISWKFIPTAAPNTSGAWERFVRSVKTALAATLRERSPSEEVLYSLLLEAEHIHNGRPLTAVNTEPTEAEVIFRNRVAINRYGTSRILVVDFT
ncbi:hypothetical protein EVAR_87875_1 [Eumeta japonica]|uniref:Integrase catalytic domain-containing protein n=1 Tax=Eumeta variegata TaxID=151549 RepID=A0A4C1WVZ8_EUMVA|nr:hypothetical protein EVAR_87875_1 [Eumeta japonica]